VQKDCIHTRFEHFELIELEAAVVSSVPEVTLKKLG
jgi:hypothetical protein